MSFSGDTDQDNSSGLKKKKKTNFIRIFIELFLILGGLSLVFISNTDYNHLEIIHDIAVSAGFAKTHYDYIEGMPDAVNPIHCGYRNQKKCIYKIDLTEKKEFKWGKLCGDDAEKEGVEKKSTLKKSCELKTVFENGREVEKNICEPCFQCNWIEWDFFSVRNYTAQFKMNNLLIDPKNAEFIGLKALESQEYKSQEGIYRIISEYYEIELQTIVVGDVKNSAISSGEPFIVSSLGIDEIKNRLKKNLFTTHETIRNTGIYMLSLGALLFLINLGGKGAGKNQATVAMVKPQDKRKTTEASKPKIEIPKINNLSERASTKKVLYFEVKSVLDGKPSNIADYLFRKGIEIEYYDEINLVFQKLKKMSYSCIIVDNEVNIKSDQSIKGIKEFDANQKVILYSSLVLTLNNDLKKSLNADGYILKKELETLVEAISK